MASRRHRFWASGLGLAMKSHAARSSVAASAPAATPLLTDLIAYWDLDESSGTRADSHTNGLDLTDNNTVGSTTGVGGSGTAADFVAANTEYLSHADDDLFSPGSSDFTYCFWAYSYSTAAQYGLIGKGIPLSNNSHEYELIWSAGGSLRWTGRSSNVADARWDVSSPALSATTWYFIEVYNDVSGNKFGVRVNNGTAVEFTTSNPMIDGTQPVYFGYRTSSIAPLAGSMQSIGYWHRLLTANERTWLFNSGSAARTYAEVAAYTG